MTSLKSIGADSDFVRSAQIRQAIRVAYEKYGATVSVEEKRKNLFKYGRNKNVGTSSATLMTLAGSSGTDIATTVHGFLARKTN